MSQHFHRAKGGKENYVMLIHADFDYYRHFGDLSEPGGTGVLILHIPNSGCPGYCLANVCFANCIKQPERKLERPIYNQDLPVVTTEHLSSQGS